MKIYNRIEQRWVWRGFARVLITELVTYYVLGGQVHTHRHRLA